jgi:hypothetical protein
MACVVAPASNAMRGLALCKLDGITSSILTSTGMSGIQPRNSYSSTITICMGISGHVSLSIYHGGTLRVYVGPTTV